MADITDVIKIEISTDQLMEAERPDAAWQPKGLDKYNDVNIAKVTRDIPLVGDKVAGGVSALTKIYSTGMDAATGDFANGTGAVGLALTAIHLARKAFDFGREITIKNRQAQEVQRRAYGDNR